MRGVRSFNNPIDYTIRLLPFRQAGEGSRRTSHKTLDSSGNSVTFVGACFQPLPTAGRAGNVTGLSLDRTVDIIYILLAISLRERKTRSLHSNINDCHTVVREPVVTSLAIRPLRLLRSSFRFAWMYGASTFAFCGPDCW